MKYAIRKWRMSAESAWLLSHLAEKYKKGAFGVCSTTPLPVPSHLTCEVKMRHMNGLVRRGWAHEPVNGIYYITEAGLEAAKIIAESC